MELNTSLQRRSKSDYGSNVIEEQKFSNIFNFSCHSELENGEPKDSFEQKKRHLTSTMVKNSLKEEILELQKQLENQFAIRRALERAICCNPGLHDFTFEYSISKGTKDLIKDIAVLELEVLYLEKYLLSMYRKAFAKRLKSTCMMDKRHKENSANLEQLLSELPKLSIKAESVISAGISKPSEDLLDNSVKECRDILGAEVLIDSGICRSHSSLSQRSAIALKTPALRNLAEAVQSCHSLPLSMLERAEESENVSLSEHVGSSIRDPFWGTPNEISEEMIKSISAIYCELAEPRLLNHVFPSSPVSFSSSRCSPQDQPDNWSLQFKETSWLDHSFHIESSKEFTSPFPTMAQVQGIRRDRQSLFKIEPVLQKFRCLVSTLEVVDPKKMKHEEKLAFWINVHNALVMHALLVYGTRRRNPKRISLLLKAAYNVGGHNISVDMIQSSILACCLPCPGQWLQSLFFPRAKYKAGDSWKEYAIIHPEPRLHFALCSGTYSDPVVRLYTPKRLFQELEVAKEEYIQANITVQKELKLLLPKKVDTFVKESGLSPSGFMELIEHSQPNCLRKVEQSQQVKFLKKIVWVPHNFTFRYLIADELIH